MDINLKPMTIKVTTTISLTADAVVALSTEDPAAIGKVLAALPIAQLSATEGFLTTEAGWDLDTLDGWAIDVDQNPSGGLTATPHPAPEA